jgi:hypothetical protein
MDESVGSNTYKNSGMVLLIFYTLLIQEMFS